MVHNDYIKRNVWLSFGRWTQSQNITNIEVRDGSKSSQLLTIGFEFNPKSSLVAWLSTTIQKYYISHAMWRLAANDGSRRGLFG